ncbi:MAG: replication-relaxation family protein [Candidatus Methylarchaceae archaeon HK02M1]|nr:replication-relaxation family protein [Candidatus Methylarchaceae archaeon HK02M1]
MVLENIMIVTIVSIASLASIIILVYYLPKIRKITKEQKDADEIVKGIISELNDRLSRQDQNIMDQQVRLDIIELKLEQSSKILFREEDVKILEGTDTRKVLEEVKDLLRVLSKNELMMSSTVQKQEKVKEVKQVDELSSTEKFILELLINEVQTSRQIQQKIKKTREHTSRLMKKLFELGYIVREEEKRPYVYVITETGKELVEKR